MQENVANPSTVNQAFNKTPSNADLFEALESGHTKNVWRN